MLTPPNLPGHIWRPLEPGDAPALQMLLAACAAVDGNPAPASPAEAWGRLTEIAPLQASLAAVGERGQLAACAWVSIDDSLRHERRAFLTPLVSPEQRGHGLGSFLLSWLEARAAQAFSASPDERPRVLRLEIEHENGAAIAFCERRGYRFANAEETLARDLSQEVPANPLPAGLALTSWSEERAALFFQAYEQAFRDRPGFPGWPFATWRQIYAGDDGFRPDLSLLLLAGGQPAGYLLAAVEEGSGWIVQVGVPPAWRRQGLAGALLAEALRRFRAEGLARVMLDVNVNNPGTQSLYRRLGFTRVVRHASYRKVLTG